ncbi:DUF742 domain-containing protein [Streptomyces sp. NPDC004609]|uniref:DUF742 domain-containing protein n=1 Tax=Streptomyces sp. NPDC004609 TaxID=3364704 RepID=UPI00367D0FE6
MVSPRAAWPDQGMHELRPYAITGGRTRPTARLSLTTRLCTRPATRPVQATPEGETLLLLCSGEPRSVAELAAHLRQPVTVARVLIGDLLDAGALTTSDRPTPTPPTRDTDLLEAVLVGLQAL